MKKILNRIYADYFMPSRLEEYEKIIKLLLEKGYKHISLKKYVKLLNNNLLKGKYFINRHDIDTDISTAKKFFEIEKKYGVKATYYFRLCTLDFEFMREIEEYGSEASYHFEEIATFAKKNHIKSKKEILKHLDKIKDHFKENFKMVEYKLGTKLKTVCSHGDFVNRKIGIINNEITKDNLLRKELGILAEAYDEKILKSVDIYLSDGQYPLDYTAKDILKKCEDKEIIYMLTHPRQWNKNWICNTKENLKRLYEYILW